ncbi:MAG: phosphomannomutase [Planctomycetes bacterium]|nr:phosphomannomutase [Planctomycetota bacterium]
MKTDDFHNADECWKIICSDIVKNAPLLKEIKKFAVENNTPVEIVFGTSGWRGEIGTDFTFNNVRITTTAIIEMFREEDPKVMAALGVKDFEEIRQRGIIVGHDSRFLGPEFAISVMGLLTGAGIKVYYAGESITPELSASIDMLNAACSINLTPSHNPSNYAGFKFNPSDGGPADTDITKIIERNANRLMSEKSIIEEEKPEGVHEINSMTLYAEFIKKRGIFDLEMLKHFIKENDCFICIDHIHGATRKRPDMLLGESTRIEYLRTNDDYLFGGIAPEPSEKNMKFVMERLTKKNSRLKLGVIMDPDGDRIRFTDGKVDISMNHFGAMALHFLHTHKKISGVLVKSVATSNFGNAVAEKSGIPIRETAVGFKNFRPFMLPGAQERAIVAYEESDGISGYNNTLEKDAMYGLFLAIEMMAVTNKNIGDYLSDLEEEFGAFYPQRAAIEVDRSLAGKLLSEKLSVLKETLAVGNRISTGSVIKDLITVDGIKVVLEDDSWFLIRPSGTEPKVRFYVESRSPEKLDDLVELAETLTKKALRGGS